MPRRIKIIFIASIVGCAVGLATFGAGAYFLWYKTLIPHIEENKKTEEKIKDATEKVSKISEVNVKLLQLQAEEKALKNQIPRKDYKANESFLEVLRVVSQESGVVVVDIKEPSGKGRGQKTPDNFEAIRLELQIKGAYNNILTFVDLLEHSKRFVGIDEFELSSLGDMSEAAIKMTAYVNRTALDRQPVTKTTYRGESTKAPN